MAKEKNDNEPYRISGAQLIEERSSRAIIPLCLSADVGLGGGIPMGCTVVIGGKFGFGKTTVALQYAANAQNLYESKVFVYPIEGRLTQQVFGQIRGIKTSAKDLEVVLPPPIYKKDKVIGHKKWDAQKWWEIIGTGIQDNPGSIHIVDSISNLSTERELSEGLGFQGRGEDKKIEAQFCRIYGDLTIASGSVLFLLCQIMANTSGYGAASSIKVGNSIKHQADIILSGKSLEKWPEENKRIRGHNMIYNVEKSAMGQSSLDVMIPLAYGVGIDEGRDVMNHAINFSMITKSGAWYRLPFIETDGKFIYTEITEDNEDNVVKVQGENAVAKWLNEHEDELKLLTALLKERLM